MLLAASLIDLEFTGDEELKHLEKGIRIGALFRHRNICLILKSFVKDDILWTLSPYYSLGSAADLCKPNGIEDELCLAYILRDVLTALDYMHERGFIHRAVRGSHVLVQDTGKCVLTGFKYNTSVITDGRWHTAIHEYPSNAKPNLNWLSPEVLEQNLLGYDSKSDIYSLGIMCCELANGQIPFSNLSATEMLLDKLTGQIPALLDSRCTNLIPPPDGGMTDEDRAKVEVFEKRRFSDLFHAFTSELCLHCDPLKRYIYRLSAFHVQKYTCRFLANIIQTRRLCCYSRNLTSGLFLRTVESRESRRRTSNPQ